MLEKEESTVEGIKVDTLEEKTCKLINWFMRNEVSTSPTQSSAFCPSVYLNKMKFDEDIPKGKKGKKGTKMMCKRRLKRNQL